MTVIARITMKDGTVQERTFRSFLELAAWMEKHHTEYKGFSARAAGVDEIKQGRT